MARFKNTHFRGIKLDSGTGLNAKGTGYNYSIDLGTTWANSATFTGLSPGNYQAQVQDTVTGCESAVQVRTVNPVPLPPAAPAASVTVQAGCSIFTGTIVITVPAKGGITHLLSLDFLKVSFSYL